MIFKFRDSDRQITQDSRLGVPIYRYTKFNEVPWSTFAQQPGTMVRVIIQTHKEAVPLDLLYLPRNSNRLLVGLHGAELRNKDLPKFQFVRSFMNQREESLLFIADSTHLYNLGNIGICWYSGSPGIDISIVYSNIIKLLISQTSIQKTVLVGHSAGGMGAIKIGSRIPSSRAIAVNAQFSALLYPSWAIKLLMDYVYMFDGSPTDFVEKYKDRFDLTYSLDNRANNSTISWFSHELDASSFGDYPNFARVCEYFGLGPEGGRTETGDVILSCRWDAPENPHALPRSVIPFIEATLEGSTEFDLKLSAEVDTRW